MTTNALSSTCNQNGCTVAADYLYTWPGHDQAGVCEEHAPRILSIARALGMYLQLIPVRCPADNQIREAATNKREACSACGNAEAHTLTCQYADAASYVICTACGEREWPGDAEEVDGQTVCRYCRFDHP